MRLLVDPETGEMAEVLPEAVLGPAEPYDYADFRRANFAHSREHREALAEVSRAGQEVASTEVAYRRELAKAVLRLKAAHGATVAETIAKGEDAVADARERYLAAESDLRTAMEKLRLVRDDRVSLSTMGSWSREADPDGWRAGA